MKEPNSPDSKPASGDTFKGKSPGRSPTAWTRMGAIAVALTNSPVTLATTLICRGLS